MGNNKTALDRIADSFEDIADSLGTISSALEDGGTLSVYLDFDPPKVGSCLRDAIAFGLSDCVLRCDVAKVDDEAHR